MSNIFKTNSRFAALAEDIPANNKKNDKKNKNEIKESPKENNSFKNDRPNDGFRNNGFADRRYNRYDEKESQRRREQREAEEIAIKEFEKQEKERKMAESLKIDNFPDLVVSKKAVKIEEPTVTYIDKIKESVTSKEASKKANIDPDLINLQPGWVLLKADKETGRTIFKTHPSYKYDPDNPYGEELLTPAEEGRRILKALVDLHEKRTNEYIDNYGYDTWEKMFKFPDWKEREAEMEDTSDEEDNYDDEEDYEDEQEYY